jgi:hypothetical protein
MGAFTFLGTENHLSFPQEYARAVLIFFYGLLLLRLSGRCSRPKGLPISKMTIYSQTRIALGTGASAMDLMFDAMCAYPTDMIRTTSDAASVAISLCKICRVPKKT